MADYSIPEILDYLLSFKLQDLSLFSYHIYYQSTHTNPYQTHYFQTIITTTNISIITFFQSFIHIIHYPFIKSNITIKHYQFCVTHTVASQRNDIHFIHTTIQIPNYPITPFHSFHSTFTFIYLNPLLLSFVLITIISVISVFCTNQTEIFVHSYQSFSSVSHSNAQTCCCQSFTNLARNSKERIPFLSFRCLAHTVGGPCCQRFV